MRQDTSDDNGLDSREVKPPPAVNLDALLRRLGGDAGGVESVLAAFTREAPSQLTQLKEATDAGEDDRVRRLAHSLKGALLWIGADRAASVAADLEKNPRGDGGTDAKVRVRALAAEVTSVLLELNSRPPG